MGGPFVLPEMPGQRQDRGRTMAAVAAFSRAPTERGIEFRVEPARTSIALVTMTAVIGLIFFVVSIATATSYGSPIPVILFCAVYGYIGYRVFRDVASRDPFTLLVTETDLVSGGRAYAISEIVELKLLNPSSKETVRAVGIVVGGSGPGMVAAVAGAAMAETAIAVGRAVGARQAARSFGLVVVTATGPAALAEGLTLEAGSDLLDQLWEAMQASSPPDGAPRGGDGNAAPADERSVLRRALATLPEVEEVRHVFWSEWRWDGVAYPDEEAARGARARKAAYMEARIDALDGDGSKLAAVRTAALAEEAALPQVEEFDRVFFSDWLWHGRKYPNKQAALDARASAVAELRARAQIDA